jgi:hypothetical protein
MLSIYETALAHESRGPGVLFERDYGLSYTEKLKNKKQN